MDLTFIRENESVVIRLIGREIYFAQVQGGIVKLAPIEGLQLNPTTIIEEFPDLKGKPIGEIKKEAIQRFKLHVKKMRNEDEIKNYLQKDLRKHNYRLIMYQKKGFRPVRVKDG